tara:strand:- start:2619 stop:3338 length:720 start_codon:yes stop_codon:yes gene_type:complete
MASIMQATSPPATQEMRPIINNKKNDKKEAYAKLGNYIQNNEFLFNIDNEPTIQEFETIIGEDIIYIADCVVNTPDNFPIKYNKNGDLSKKQREYLTDDPDYKGKKIDYMGLCTEWQEDANDWLYILSYNDHVVKIGMTVTSLKERYESYSCGTTRAMDKGSCSTTNFIISECNYTAKNKGMDVKIYGIPCPPTLIEKTRFGVTKTCRSSTVRDEETMLTKRFKDVYGHIPMLCVQTGS